MAEIGRAYEPTVSFAKGVKFWRFKRHVASFCVAGVALCDIQTGRKTRRKWLLLKLRSVEIGGNAARNARFDAPPCLVLSLWLSSDFAVSMEEAAQSTCFKVPKQVVWGLCLKCLALRDNFMCLQTCRKPLRVTVAEIFKELQL